MAKRKRLEPSLLISQAGRPGSPQKGVAPIADIAGGAALGAALEEVTEELSRARTEERLVQRIKLEDIDVNYIVRDRIEAEPEALGELEASIRANGQRSPIDVVEVGQGRYGLISGWRRIKALREIGSNDALALVRKLDDAADAYVAMVEENEIRLGLSHFERARIAAKAVEIGVYETVQAAVAALFASGSRARRSKIVSFTRLYTAIGEELRFPTAIGERLGLALVAKLDAEPEAIDALSYQLREANSESPDSERAVLEEFLRPEKKKSVKPSPEQITDTVSMYLQAGKSQTKLILTGKGVSPELADEIKKLIVSRAKQ